MARLFNSGFELNSITDGVEFSTNQAPVSIGTTNVRSGTYAGRVNAGAGFWRQVMFSANQTTVGYIGIAVYIVAGPNANTQLIRWSTTGNVSVGNITMTTTRTLVLLASSGAQIGSASAALNLNQWYYIEFKSDASTSPGALEGRIDGVVFASGANSNQGSWARALVGNVTGVQTTNDIWFDDWKINDSTGSSQTSYPGSGNLVRMSPDSAGDSNAFLVQVGGTAGNSNNFTRVNEVTPDDAVSYNASAVLNAEDLFNCGASGIGVNDTVNVVTVAGRFANLVSADATAAIKLEIEKTSGGTKAQSAAIIPNATTWASYFGGGLDKDPLVTYLDPDGNPWTQATLDTMQIGYIETVANTSAIAMTNIWAYVDYTPNTAPSTAHNLSITGAGN